MAEIENALAEIRVDEFLALIDLRDGEALSREDVRDEMNHPREFAWVERRKGRNTLQTDGLELYLRVVSTADQQRGGDSALVLQ